MFDLQDLLRQDSGLRYKREVHTLVENKINGAVRRAGVQSWAHAKAA